MQTSEQLDKFAAAFSQAQGAIEQAPRTHTATVNTRSGGSYSYSYTDLATVLAMCRKAFADSQLSVVQSVKFEGGHVSVVTRLLHSSGQWLESDPLPLPVVSEREDGKITPQAIGSSVTYAKRYSLCSLLGIASEMDDDGNAGSGQDATTTERDPLPECPNCKTSKAVIVGKQEYGGGLVCFKKKGGCGQAWGTEKYPSSEQKKHEPAQPSSGTRKGRAQVEDTPSNAADPLIAPRTRLEATTTFTAFKAAFGNGLAMCGADDTELDTRWRSYGETWLKSHIPNLQFTNQDQFNSVREWTLENLPDKKMRDSVLKLLDAKEKVVLQAA